MGNIATIAISTHGSKIFTHEGLAATFALCDAIDRAYKKAGTPVTFHGHREIDPRPCPVYDYKALLALDAVGNMGTDTSSWPRLNIEDPAHEEMKASS